MTAYECFVKRWDDLEDGKEIVLTIRDLSPGRRKYNARVVRAMVSRAEEALSTWDRLLVRSVVGIKDPRPWAIKIVEELGETVPGKPYSDIFDALDKLRDQVPASKQWNGPTARS